MHNIMLEEIKQKARQYQANGMSWHFHILTPSCALNDKDQYAFILECPEEDEQFVYYSDKAEKELGRELAPMLHGAKVLDKEKSDKNYQPSAKIEKILERAKELNDKVIEWHHHVLFPDCKFNQHAPKFVFVFEDPKSGEMIENLTNKEPSADIKALEPLFYKNNHPRAKAAGSKRPL